MTDVDLDCDTPKDKGEFLLSDYIRSANALDAEHNDDGSTTIYLQLHRRERYSTLPRSRRKSWFVRVFGSRSAPQEDRDRLGVAANVRKVPRRRSDLA
ncbi:MAG: hypothetical protein BMS9Abin12_1940 [Acidimicrobiia bacterium]|nr:MAG: hypothetical protein BMS9Abin12_1940 [Acidimicrobiia bacterium]